MDKSVKVHIGLHSEPADRLRSLPSAERSEWVAQHLKVDPVSFDTFETYGFLTCTLGDSEALSDLETAQEVEWVEIDSKMSIR